MKQPLAFRSRRACSALVLALALLAGAVAGVLHLVESPPSSGSVHASYLEASDPGVDPQHKCAFCVAAPVFHVATAMPSAAVARLTASEPARASSRAHLSPVSSTHHARAPPHPPLS